MVLEQIRAEALLLPMLRLVFVDLVTTVMPLAEATVLLVLIQLTHPTRIVMHEAVATVPLVIQAIMEQRRHSLAMLVVIVVRLGTMVRVPYQQNLVAVS